jgi:hypothetical protein
MVVPLILLGTATKLAFAVAVTHRTRWWWVPGLVAMGLGAGAVWTDRVPEIAGEGAVVLGGCALVLGGVMGFTPRSSRTVPGARSSRRGAR